MNRFRWIVLVAVMLLGIVAISVAVPGCAASIPNREPVGELFPRVVGESLDGKDHELPGDFRGEPVLLLIGYVQDAQFDCDRWLLGALQAKLSVPVYEIPTIKGMIPGMIASTIDQGMRNGIPEENWPSVITVYGDAGSIVNLTGNENPRNARVLLLNGDGRVVWFHDRGYSPQALLAANEMYQELIGE